MTQIADSNPERTTAELAHALREEVHPLPSAADGFPRVLLIGTTGAGKTTLVRQLLGTDPETERFPSTSTARTTVADTEIVVDPTTRAFHSTVTFVPRSEIRAALQDCFLQAALAIVDEDREREVLRRLLEHPEQRFRFRYLLGNVQLNEAPAEAEPSTDGIDLAATRTKVLAALDALQTFVRELREDIEDDHVTTNGGASDEDVREELEEEIERLAASDTILSGHLEALIDEMQTRFDLISQGDVLTGDDGWPLRWTWNTSDRATFIETINRFSSNYSQRFGRLLTPLVNGIRVTGPFHPSWMADEHGQFVLIDVEGLGHTPDSSSSVPGRLVAFFDQADRVLLVDNAQQPMQAATIAALRAMLTSGNIDKRLIAFTHLDQVTGDNLATDDDRIDHVLGAAESVVIALGRELAPRDEQRLKSRLNRATLLGGLHERPTGTNATTEALRELMAVIQPRPVAPPPAVIEAARPIYEAQHFEEATRAAATTFLRRWRGYLGIEVAPDAPKEHWARVKALSRRLAELGQEEYLHLRPVSDLHTLIRDHLYQVVRDPLWIPHEPPDEVRDQALDEFLHTISMELASISRRRVWTDHVRDWWEGYVEQGPGSTHRRAAILDRDIFTPPRPSPLRRTACSKRCRPRSNAPPARWTSNCADSRRRTDERDAATAAAGSSRPAALEAARGSAYRKEPTRRRCL